MNKEKKDWTPELKYVLEEILKLTPEQYLRDKSKLPQKEEKAHQCDCYVCKCSRKRAEKSERGHKDL